MFQLQLFFAPLWRMGPRCSSAETQVCHRSYIIAARFQIVFRNDQIQIKNNIDQSMTGTSQICNFFLGETIITRLDY